jgi:hypothetical protein
MVSPDGSKLACYNFLKSRFAQVGYGVIVPDKYTSRNFGPVENDGIFVTDISTGHQQLIVSIKDIYEKSVPAINIPNPTIMNIIAFWSNGIRRVQDC